MIFDGVGKCASCHAGPELTGASIAHVEDNFIERMITGNKRVAV